jgi:hypothetical protein
VQGIRNHTRTNRKNPGEAVSYFQLLLPIKVFNFLFCDNSERIKYLLGQLKESLDLLQSLKDATEKKHASYDHVCGRVQDASQPRQTVKFLMWITKNADALAKYIPGFGVRASYIPNVEFVEEVSNENSRK